MRKITKIEPVKQVLIERKKVAAYARVSMETEKMEHSLSAQISYYNELIQSNPEWQFVGVYADDAISGTGAERRDEFQRMIRDAEAGKIDLILTKGISRWARNTVDLLETVRMLRSLNVGVLFEKENINTLNGDGELMLSILASFAQEESRNISDNCKWGIRKRYESGKIRNMKLYGYELKNGKMAIVPEQAEIIREVFRRFIDGEPCLCITNDLRARGVKAYKGRPFGNTSVRRMLSQEKYTGNAMLQKYYVTDHITHKQKENRGELPMYYAEEVLPAIIDMETFQKAQELIASRPWRTIAPERSGGPKYPFSGMLMCAGCGYKLNPNYYEGRRIWRCVEHQKNGGTKADRPVPVYEETLLPMTLEVLGQTVFDEKDMRKKLDCIRVLPDALEFRFNDGTIEQRELKRKRRMSDG